MDTYRSSRDKPDRARFYSYLVSSMHLIEDCQLGEEQAIRSIAEEVVVAHVMMISLLNMESDPAVDVYRSLENKQNYFVKNRILTYDDLLDLKAGSQDELCEANGVILKRITASALRDSPKRSPELRLAAISGGLEDEEALIYESEWTLSNARSLYQHLKELVPEPITR